MNVLNASKPTRHIYRKDLVVQNSRVPKLPRTLSNNRVSLSTGMTASKTTTAHFPRLLGRLSKPQGDSVVYDNSNTMIWPKNGQAKGKDTKDSCSSDIVPELTGTPEIPSNLPRWERDLAQAEFRTLSRRLPNSTSRGQTVSRGFWQSMKLTPGEMDLKFNRNQNSVRKPQLSVPKQIPRKANLRITKSRSSPNLIVPTIDVEPKTTPAYHKSKSSVDFSSLEKQNSQLYDRFSRQPVRVEEDPDKLNMVHIVSALHGQLDESSRESEISTRREKNRYGGPKKGRNPPSAVELALKASRRYRHPERPIANMPMSPRKQEDVTDWSQKKPSGVERALKHSSTYETQQRHKRNKEATQSDLRKHYANNGNTSVSRSMALYALSLPLEAEPYSLTGLRKKRTVAFESPVKLHDSCDDGDWKMHLSPKDWVRLLKANPGDPIFKTLGIEDQNAGADSKVTATAPIRLPTIEDNFSDTDSFISNAPVSKVRIPRTGSAELTHAPRERHRFEDGQVGEILSIELTEPPKTPVPFNSPESSPRSILSSDEEEEETNTCRVQNDVIIDGHLPVAATNGHSDREKTISSNSQHLHLGNKDAQHGTPNKKVVIVVPSKDTTDSVSKVANERI